MPSLGQVQVGANQGIPADVHQRHAEVADDVGTTGPGLRNSEVFGDVAELRVFRVAVGADAVVAQAQFVDHGGAEGVHVVGCEALRALRFLTAEIGQNARTANGIGLVESAALRELVAAKHGVVGANDVVDPPGELVVFLGSQQAVVVVAVGTGSGGRGPML